MSGPSRSRPDSWEELRRRVLGLGERSFHKSYYPELQQRLRDLEESETRFRELVDLLPEIVFETDLQGRLTFLNRRAAEYAEMIPVTPEIGLPVTELLVPEDRQRAAENMSAILDGRRPGQSRYNARAHNGPPIPIMIHSAPIYRDGAPTGLRGVLVDLSEPVRLEQRMAASQRLESLGRLASGVAHDFNNILGAIEGLCGLALDTLDESHPAHADLTQILAATERAASLTDQLLLFCRRRRQEAKPSSISRFISGMVRLLEPLLGEDIQVVTELEGGADTVLADTGQLEQVVMNLAINARDAMPTGGRLTIRTRSATLDGAQLAPFLGSAVAGEHVLLEMEDTGHGIPPDIQPKIFDPFYTTKPSGHGTGLGLATVYGIVKSAGGGIAVHSTPGSGTTFRVILPLVEAAPESKQPQGAPLGSTGTEHVLAVEDDPAMRSVITRGLEGRGYHVLTARSPREALDIAREHPGPIDLVLTDVVMPEMSGPALIEQLLELRPWLRVLYISGHADDEAIRRGVELQEIELLPKPFTTSALATRVRAVLDAPSPSPSPSGLSQN